MIILYFIFIVKLEILRKLKFFGIDKINIILYRFHNHGIIVLGIIKIHLKSCRGKIILKWLRVLLISYFLNRRMLVHVKLDVHV